MHNIKEYDNIDYKNKYAEALLVDTSLEKVAEKANCIIDQLQRKLSSLTITHIDINAIIINDFNIILPEFGANDLGAFYNKKPFSAMLIATEQTRRYGLCAKIIMRRVDTVNRCPAEWVRDNNKYELIKIFTHYSDEPDSYEPEPYSIHDLPKYCENKKNRINHYIIFFDRFKELMEKICNRLKEKVIDKSEEINVEYDLIQKIFYIRILSEDIFTEYDRNINLKERINQVKNLINSWHIYYFML